MLGAAYPFRTVTPTFSLEPIKMTELGLDPDSVKYLFNITFFVLSHTSAVVHKTFGLCLAFV